jgi:hypothetical protein
MFWWQPSIVCGGGGGGGNGEVLAVVVDVAVAAAVDVDVDVDVAAVVAVTSIGGTDYNGTQNFTRTKDVGSKKTWSNSYKC